MFTTTTHNDLHHLAQHGQPHDRIAAQIALAAQRHIEIPANIALYAELHEAATGTVYLTIDVAHDGDVLLEEVKMRVADHDRHGADMGDMDIRAGTNINTAAVALAGRIHERIAETLEAVEQ